MHLVRKLWTGALALAVAGALVPPADATTLIRAGLETLVAGNNTIIVGEVVEVFSYWNADGSFILTDVTVVPSEVAKGEAAKGEITLTLMGGDVGDLATVIVAGARLELGKSYVLFLGESDLPGVTRVLTVRDHCQGVFDLVPGPGGLRAVSQANEHPLLPDGSGLDRAPGGSEGLDLDSLLSTIAQLAAQSGKGVTP